MGPCTVRSHVQGRQDWGGACMVKPNASWAMDIWDTSVDRQTDMTENIRSTFPQLHQRVVSVLTLETRLSLKCIIICAAFG